MEVNLTVNGETRTIHPANDETLLRVLREDLKLTGAKQGCDDEGSCGCCTVLVDGAPRQACLVPAKGMDGKTVTTIEGLADPATGGPHPIQQAFIDAGAVQCGYCTPGMILTAKWLLDRNPSPSVDEIKKALNRILCRCTGYTKVIDAVRLASRMIAQEEVRKPRDTGTSGAVGQSIPKPDALRKVTGRAMYSADLAIEGMLYGRVVWRDHPHAKLLGIDITEAQALPRVHAVLTAKDIPGDNLFGAISADQPVLAEDRVRFVGDPVALVFAETPEQASAAAECVRADFEPLPPVFSPEEALAEGAPNLHEGGNILTHLEVETGDVDAALSGADVVVDDCFRTPFVDQGFLEPEAGLASFDQQGDLTIWTGVQNPFDIRRQIATALGMPVEKVRLINMAIGGAFGGKCDVSLQIFLALGALHTRRPVKMVFSRRESLRFHPKRHAFEMRYRIGASRDGKLVGIDADIVGDTGAYASWGKIVLQSLAGFACGPYVVPNSRVSLKAVYTNNPPAGAWRGFGVPQAHVALESQMDALARRLGMDPFRFRDLNGLEAGSVTYIGQPLPRSVGFKKTLKAVEEELGRIVPGMQPKARDGRLGIGVAGGFKSVGFPIAMQDSGGAMLRIGEKGEFLLDVAVADLGQGSDTTLAQIAAQRLGVPLRCVSVEQIDTDIAPDAGPTVASRMTYLAGNAVVGAVEEMRDQLVAQAADQFGRDRPSLDISDGWIVDLRTEKEIVRIEEFAKHLAERGQDLRVTHRFVESKTDQAQFPVRFNKPSDKPQDYYYASYAYATHAAVVEVNTRSGRVEVRHVVAAHDVGRAIHPQNIEGQIEGSAVMGIGTTLSESFQVDRGYVVTDTLNACGLTRMRVAPEITSVIIEDQEPSGPFGAKGIGEVATIPTSPAILNAIYDAVGIRITELPVDPTLIREAMRREGHAADPE